MPGNVGEATVNMSKFSGKMSVIIPSYRPDGKLIEVVRKLREKGFGDIILVVMAAEMSSDRFSERYLFFPR